MACESKEEPDMGVIDADAHVIETQHTWSFMLEDERRFAPELLISNNNKVEYWRVDDRVFPNSNLGLNVPQESRDLTDVAARLAHMDSLGIDIQVLYPSLFLRPLTARSEVDAALCRGYNRWLADIWKRGAGRLRWVVLPPLRRMDQALEEINFGKANGACGVFMRGFEGEHLLSDSYLFPLYEEAQRLDLPICVHAGTGNLAYYDHFGLDVFSRFKLPSVGAFNNLIYQGTPAKFPELRWTFVETTSQWIPYAINDLVIRTQAERAFQQKYAGHALAQVRPKERQLAAGSLLRDNRIYVACQTTDDFSYVMEYAGEDNLTVGTDYGHADYSNDIEAIQTLMRGGKISASLGRKILEDNPRRLYGL
jgi:predicted TIM-barrel fold metal-dependent hydrolase